MCQNATLLEITCHSLFNDMICLQKQQVLQTYLDNKAEEEEIVYQMVEAAQKGIQFNPRYMTYIIGQLSSHEPNIFCTGFQMNLFGTM